MRFSFILLAGGNSDRFKSNKPKQYHEIAGKTLTDISLNKIREFKEIKKIILVCGKNHKTYLKKLNLKNVRLIIGGDTRSESTYRALRYLKKKKIAGKVLIHDAARPNFSRDLIKRIIINSKKNNVVIPILKIHDALKLKLKKQIIHNLDRDNYLTTQTPQCFDINEIFYFHGKKKYKYKDDDLSLVSDSSKIKFINGEKKNLKITNKEDLNLFENLYKSNIKIGIGFDVHRLVKERKLYLGGVKIPSKLGTLGHSDGDPVLHAVIDAILGACGMGDIGEIFSDKNKKYKGISSTKLIKKVIVDIKRKNYMLNNIDINIITQSPKLKQFKKKITFNIANLCGVSINNVNIKAKTTEKLGVIGQEKAIAAEVIVSVIKHD